MEEDRDNLDNCMIELSGLDVGGSADSKK